LLAQFGDDPFSAIAKYREFVLHAPASDFPNGIVSRVAYGSREFASFCSLKAHNHGNLGEIPTEQRYAGRPELSYILDGPGKKAEMVIKAVEVYGYTQKSVADKLGVHYSAISKMLTRQMSSFKT
jgi:hypothetical protein